MYGILLAVMVLTGIFLGVVILLQAGKGGGLAAMGGSGTATDGIMAGRQAQSVLTRATWTAGTAFMILALVLSIMSSRAQQPESILRPDAPSALPAPEPVLPGTTSDTGAASDPSGGTGDAPGASSEPVGNQ